eukprot:c13836_g1_i1 orf=569-1069(-)
MTIAADVDDLPRTNVRRVVKAKLAELTKDSPLKKEISVHKEAVLAFAESAKIFIHYLSATANDICRESKRQTVNADDVLKAVEEIDFPEFSEPMIAALEEFRKDTAIKKSEAKIKGTGQKRKSELITEENGLTDNMMETDDHEGVNEYVHADEDGHVDEDDIQYSE